MNPVFTGNKFDRSLAELQQYILTCILTAGQKAEFAEQKANDITADIPEGNLPCEFLIAKDDLDGYLRSRRTGKYRYLAQAIRRIAELDLTTATEQELRSVPGISFKTARIFLLRSRRDAPHAALDVHTLRFLRDHSSMEVPDRPPSSECEYLKLEAELLRLFAEKYPALSPAEADEKVWNLYRAK
jgi:thermostable 8-oxoguanine DNA glycosylase